MTNGGCKPEGVPCRIPKNSKSSSRTAIRRATECHEELGRHAWITLTPPDNALCLDYADLGHLIFLPSGSVALTRRAKKHSRLWAVVLKWSRARKQYERQGLLVESEALEKAEQECLADAEARERRREREAFRRVGIDEAFVQAFAARIREMFPGCPPAHNKRSPNTLAKNTAAASADPRRQRSLRIMPFV